MCTFSVRRGPIYIYIERNVNKCPGKESAFSRFFTSCMCIVYIYFKSCLRTTAAAAARLLPRLTSSL